MAKDAKQIVGASLVAGGAVLAAVVNIPGIAWSSINLIVVTLNLNVWNWSMMGISLSYSTPFCNPQNASQCAPSAGPLVVMGGWLLLVTIAALAAAAIMAFVSKPKPAGFVALGGAATGALTIVLFTIGVNSYSSELLHFFVDLGRANSSSSASIPADFNIPPSLALGFFLACAGVAAAIAGGILLLVARAPTPQAQGGYLAYIPGPSQPAYGSPNPYPTPAPGAYAQPSTRAIAPPASPPSAGRRLRCPKCTNVFMVAPGARPVCTSCGFGG
ncbi:MAG: hypothetical protein V4510_11340 [bacterium]